MNRVRFTRIRRLYPNASRRQRFVIRLRLVSLKPLIRLADRHLPRSGRALDAGCGYGALSHWLAQSAGRRLVAVDLSADRIAVAQASCAPPNLTFAHGDGLAAIQQTETPWDGYIFADSLLYSTPDEQIELLQAARKRASDNAVLLVKDSTATPRWKLAYTRWEERLKLERDYYGASRPLTLTYRSLDEWRDVFEATGWRLILAERVGRWTPYPGWVGACHAD